MARAAGLATAFAVALAAWPAAAQLSADAQKAYTAFQRLAPHRVFMLAPNGRGYTWSGAAGADPSGAIERGLKYCEDSAKAKCSLYAVNNVVLNGRDWKTAAPPMLPPIGRLRAQPFWHNKGPLAAGMIVWSHGYMEGKDATANAPPVLCRALHRHRLRSLSLRSRVHP